MNTAVKNSWKTIMLWVLPVLAFICAVLFAVPGLKDNPAVGMPVVLVGFVFALIHGYFRYGLKGVLVSLGLCLAVSFLLENVSILTGFPFGHYHYTMRSMMTLRLYRVPVLVGVAYYGMGYASWVIANILLDKADGNPKSNYSRFALPAVAAFIMCMWDVCMDPFAATINKSWIWHDGGGFFGVPLSNYLGWYFCVWLFFQLFALYLSFKKDSVITDTDLVKSKSYFLQPVLMYFATGVTYVSIYFSQGRARDYVDQAGQVWHSTNIHESAVILFLFTMLFASVLAGIKVFQQGRQPAKEALEEA